MNRTNIIAAVALGLVVGAGVLLSTGAVITPPPGVVGTLTASTNVISPKVQTSTIVEKTGGFVAIVNVDGGYAAEIGDYGVSGIGYVSTANLCLAAGDPDLCGTGAATHPSLVEIASSPFFFVKVDDVKGQLELENTQFPDAGIAPFSARAFNSHGPTAHLWDFYNAQTSLVSYVQADGTYVGPVEPSAVSLGTCSSSFEGQIERDSSAGGTNTSHRTRLCMCTSDGAASPAYAWRNVVTGTVGTSTTCSD